ncbi:hypothetical protein ASG52_25140 [Methylobacterium sp. Leaf456]|nr:hypothetical protein ASG52_25140 [Methylobacterium sp. Leaf456]
MEREIVQGEISVMEQQVVIHGLRSGGLATVAAESALDQMETRLVGLWARRAALIHASNQPVPKGKLR